jgi:hypothetical protein
MWVQVLAQVVIKADNRDRQQNNLWFPYNPPLTILGFSERLSVQQIEPTARGRGSGGVFTSKLLGPLINCNIFPLVTNFSTLWQCWNPINLLVTTALLFQKDCSRDSLSPSPTWLSAWAGTLFWRALSTISVGTRYVCNDVHSDQITSYHNPIQYSNYQETREIFLWH